jgi:hypothetical protein
LEILTWDDKIMSVVGHIIEIHIMSVVREATIVGRKGVCSLVFDNVFPAWFDLSILLTDFFSEKKTANRWERSSYRKTKACKLSHVTE